MPDGRKLWTVCKPSLRFERRQIELRIWVERQRRAELERFESHNRWQLRTGFAQVRTQSNISVTARNNEDPRKYRLRPSIRRYRIEGAGAIEGGDAISIR